MVAELKPPVCPECGVEGKIMFSSPASRYGIPIEDVLEDPSLAMPRSYGEYYCPKCRRGLGGAIPKEA